MERIGLLRCPLRAAVALCAVAGFAYLSAAIRSETADAAARYPVAGGQAVQVEVDSAWAGTDAVERILDTLGAAPHGPEMDKLTVHIADAGTLSRFCGANSTACYLPSSQTMVVSGDPVNRNNQMPQGMVITHEYGHHIEANRSFPGWYATDLGGRHWATYERVCEGVAAGSLFPGNQGLHYWENPGEAFAQAYATMVYANGAPWWWSFAKPSEAAFEAIRADIADASPGTTVRWGQKLNRGSPRATTSFTTSLDGPITVSVRQPRRARFEVSLLTADGQVLTRGQAQRRWPGKRTKGSTTSTLSYGTCGAGGRSFQLQVRRLAGKGKFTADITRP